MGRRIRALAPPDMDDAQRALYAAITGGPRSRGPQHFALTEPGGELRGPFDGFLRSPAVGTAAQELGAAIRFRTSLTDRGREIAILLVAARTRSAFEREAHEAVGRAAGLTDGELAALRHEDGSAFAGDEAVVADTVIGLLDGDLDDSRWASARDAVGERGLFELTTLVGYYAMLALQLRVFRVDA